MSFRLHDADAFAVDLEQIIISIILFSGLFAHRVKIYSMSAAHVPLVLPCLAANFVQVIVPVICFLLCLLSRY